MGNPTYQESITVARPPEDLYAMVSDVTRMGEWSPVCKACSWEGDARGEGAWFTGHNVLPERSWDTRSRVAVAEPGQEFAWIVGGDRVRWGYTFSAADGGTVVTESWEFLPAGLASFDERYGAEAQAQVATRAEAARTGIPATLAAFKRTAESA
ncbi:MAG: SRPBCC family protein [Candidatus Dormibacteraceae bacterium]